MKEETPTPKKKRRIHPWPLAIIMSLLVFMSGIVYAVTLMMGKEVPMVAENYYEEELRYQEQIDIEQRTLSTNRIPKLVRQEDGQTLLIQFSENSNIEMDAGTISFERPANPVHDFTVPVNPDATGKQLVSMGDAKPGLYLVRISWKEDGVDYYHEKKYSF